MRVNLNYLQKANKCKSTDDTRYYLEGVYVKYNRETRELTYTATRWTCWIQSYRIC